MAIDPAAPLTIPHPPVGDDPLGDPNRPGERVSLSGGRANNIGDGIFHWGTMGFALSVLVVCALIFYQLFRAAIPSIREFGLGFITRSTWDPVNDVYGAWPFIFGTLVSSFLALLLAVPVAIGTAIFLTELAPKWMRTPVAFLVELLAAVPSVVYGLWGIFVLIPVLRPFQVWLGEHFGWLPFFKGPATGLSMMAGALILAIMVLPFITAVSREVIKAVPPSQREAAFGLGATHWEAVKGPIFALCAFGHYGRDYSGIGARSGRNDGGYDGDRQRQRSLVVAVRARQHAGERAGQPVRRSQRAAVARADVCGVGFIRHHDYCQRTGAPVVVEYVAQYARSFPRMNVAASPNSIPTRPLVALDAGLAPRRKLANSLMWIGAITATALAIIPLALVLYYVTVQGVKVLA